MIFVLYFLYSLQAKFKKILFDSKYSQFFIVEKSNSSLPPPKYRTTPDWSTPQV